MNDTVRGLILRQTDYKEADVILQVLTKEYGMIAFRASGIRRMTSKNAGSVFPYTEADLSFDYKDGKTIFRLKTARTANLYRRMHTDMEMTAAAALVSEIAEQLTPHDDILHAAKAYDLLKKAYELINGGAHIHTCTALFMADMMRLNGITPQVDACLGCGRSDIAAFSAKEGGFLCRECAAALGIMPQQTADLKRIRLLVKATLERYELVSQSTQAQLSDAAALVEMIRTHTGTQVRSFRFYETAVQ